MKKSRQSDVVERLKPPVPERPKLVSRNLQTKDVLDENLKEENRERNNEESGKDGGYHCSETKEIKIDQEDDERGVLINDAPQTEMEPPSSNLEDEDDKEEEESDDVNTPFLQNGKEVLCYAWQIAKGMVRTFSTEECFEQFSHRL